MNTESDQITESAQDQTQLVHDGVAPGDVAELVARVAQD